MIGLRPAFSTMLFLLLLTGGVYPLLTTALGQWWFPWQANGSLIHKDNVIRGLSAYRTIVYRRGLFSWPALRHRRYAL